MINGAVPLVNCMAEGKPWRSRKELAHSEQETDRIEAALSFNHPSSHKHPPLQAASDDLKTSQWSHFLAPGIRSGAQQKPPTIDYYPKSLGFNHLH